MRSLGCHIANQSYHNTPMLNVGDSMPDVTLTGDAGPVKLRDKLGKPLVVYFYPKDETYGCTKEACSFRDSYEDFVGAGADVIGISRDDAESHAKFKTHHRLPFTLLSDDGSAARAFGVKGAMFGLVPGRVTFVFDKDGKTRHRFESNIQFGKHVDEALAVVKQLGDGLH
jgi:thioredoxin-dependent peroxiredoxin